MAEPSFVAKLGNSESLSNKRYKDLKLFESDRKEVNKLNKLSSIVSIVSTIVLELVVFLAQLL